MCCFISLPCFEVKPARAAGEKDLGRGRCRDHPADRVFKKKQNGKGSSGGMPSHSCTCWSFITWCEFITLTDRLSRAEHRRLWGNEAFPGQRHRNLGPLILTDWRAHRWVSQTVCELCSWYFQGHWSSELANHRFPLYDMLTHTHTQTNKKTCTPQSSASRQRRRYEWVIYITRLEMTGFCKGVKCR